ncbi:hypothetical protein [Glaciimonas sp. PCH181]|uniref:hypothetical protein n=1 Tax=Glaciimonas sp. PCH181 TaxID=2133943 RepID=UPI001375001F|nr:hypothetical protein [Glaciimonas sp. PCH181]
MVIDHALAAIYEGRIHENSVRHFDDVFPAIRLRIAQQFQLRSTRHQADLV